MIVVDDGRFGSSPSSATLMDEDELPEQEYEPAPQPFLPPMVEAEAADKPKRKYTKKVKPVEPVEPQGHAELGPVTNGAEAYLGMAEPWAVKIRLRGVAPMLMHRWNSESIEEKAGGPRGSIQRKTDDVESYVWRNEQGYICLPGEYVRQSILGASKRISDPTNVRKRAVDLFKASIIATTELAPILVNGKPCKEWELLDRRRVRVQQAGITRSRPAFLAGWEAELGFVNLSPELISFDLFHNRLVSAGRLDVVADFRPSYGRFSILHIEKEAYVEVDY